MRAALLIALLAAFPASRGYVSDFANVLDDETTRTGASGRTARTTASSC